MLEIRVIPLKVRKSDLSIRKLSELSEIDRYMIYIISHFGCSVPIFWGRTIGMNKDIDINMNQDRV